MNPSQEIYTPQEVALAAGVPEADVVAALEDGREFVNHADAVRIGRLLAKRSQLPAEQAALQASPTTTSPQTGPLFSIFLDAAAGRRTGMPLAVSSAVHAVLIATFMLAASFDLAPRAAMLRGTDPSSAPMPLVFLAEPGPGGGGGGGGLRQQAPAPKGMSEGRSPISSPMPRATSVAALKRPEQKPEPPPPSEPLPVVMAPVAVASADMKNRTGVIAQTAADSDGRGPGTGGGAGTGKGTGLGEGDGSGIGPGTGGGTGGGPFRPGSGIEPPRLLHEVKADYTEDARQRGITGDVVLEIVVRHDGAVGDVRVLQGLGGGLDDRAVQAVRQWRFSPARRLNAAVDVVVEVAVEFKLR